MVTSNIPEASTSASDNNITTANRPDSPAEPSSPSAAQYTKARTRTSTNSSGLSGASNRLRSASIKLMQADAPLGMWAATGSQVSKAPSIADIRRGTFHHEDGWNHERYAEHHERKQVARTASGQSVTSLGGRRRRETLTGEGDNAFPRVEEEPAQTTVKDGIAPVHKDKHHDAAIADEKGSSSTDAPQGKKVYPNGYSFPDKLPWTTSWKIGLISFGKWACTPLGAAITIYGLNVVAWGGMLFLLLCNAAPAMCHPTCNDINSPRRIWIEIDSQILNALFCVTGFGLIPWRFRDLYWLMVYRLGIRGRKPEQRQRGIRMLAGIHRGWFRLRGSEDWNREMHASDVELEKDDAVPLPLSKKLSAPLTGERAPPSAYWRMDFVIWMNVWNTFLQACLCGFMWGYNRYKRPSWSTGFFVAIACIVAGLGGIMMAIEGKRVKKFEGVPPKVAQSVEDVEARVGSATPATNTAAEIKVANGNVETQEVVR